MRKATLLFFLGAGLWVGACIETTGPPPATRPLTVADRQLHVLQWMPAPVSREFAAWRTTPDEPPAEAPSATPPLLSSYSLTFWAYAWKDQ